MNPSLNKYFFYYPVLLLRGQWFLNEYKSMIISQYFSLEQIKEYQNKKLIRLLKYAKKWSPYYQDRLPSNTDIDSLNSLGYIDKATLRNNSASLCAPNIHFRLTKTTGGSTGAAVTIFKNPKAMGAELSAAWRGYSWAGIKIGEKQARFWGTPQSNKYEKLRAKTIDFICNRYRISAFGVSFENWNDAFFALKRFKPNYFYGYVSMIKEFALYIKDHGLIGQIRPKAIVTTSEVLTDEDRSIISFSFCCRVYNEYGCGEVNTIAHECEYGNLHINAENLIVEVADNNGIPLKEGNAGEIVITDLNNLAMPLIRYRLADWGVLSNRKCACGRCLPIIEKVYGRSYDFLINSSGEYFHGEFFLYIIEDAKKKNLPVNGVQFIQKANKRIIVRIVCDKKYYIKLREYIIARLQSGFDDKLPISVEQVDSIQREKSGKLRVVKREFFEQ